MSTAPRIALLRNNSSREHVRVPERVRRMKAGLFLEIPRLSADRGDSRINLRISQFINHSQSINQASLLCFNKKKNMRTYYELSIYKKLGVYIYSSLIVQESSQLRLTVRLKNSHVISRLYQRRELQI